MRPRSHLFSVSLGEPSGLIGYLSDITPRIENEKTMRLQSRIFEHSDESILITDAQQRILSVNPAFTEVTGYTEREVIGRTPSLLRSDRHPAKFYEDIWTRVEQDGSWHGEVWSQRKNGEEFPGWASIGLVRNRDGQVSNYFSIFTDITERKKAKERIHYLAYYDGLTGLPNRAMLYKLIDQSFVRGIPHDGNDGAIAGAIVSMAQRLGHRTIAEGVETMAQFTFLRSLGCHEIQGYLFSPPVPPEKFEAMLRDDRRLLAG